MTRYRIDRNAHPDKLRQACRDMLNATPYKSAPRFKPLRALLQSHIEDLTHDLPKL